MKRVTKNYTKEVYKSRDEWLANRGIGGSSAAAILDLNPWLSKLQLYNSFIFGHKAKPDNEILAYGRTLEPLIRKEFQADFPQYKVREPRGYEQYRRKDMPLLTATVDGLLTEEMTRRKGILEIKTHDVRSSVDAEEWKNGSIPNNYLIQVLHYLLVLNDCEFVKFVARLRYFDYSDDRRVTKCETIYHSIEREDVEEQLKFLEAKEYEFTKNIEMGIPPDGRIKF